jgi:hypothetical protein
MQSMVRMDITISFLLIEVPSFMGLEDRFESNLIIHDPWIQTA